ncbi:Putative ribonuclease H protein At1g65750, partial [Linum perenne]
CEVWEDPWLREDDGCWVRSGEEEGLAGLKVIDLARPEGGGWDEEMIEALFEERDKLAILRVQPPVKGREDRRVWHVSQSGDYTVKSAYRLAIAGIIEGEEMGRHDEWRRLWQMEVPPKIRHLLWRASREVLPTRNALRNKGMNMVDRCGLCDAEGETVTHLFLRCEVARRCWQLVGGDGLDPVGREEAASWKEWWLNALKDGRRELLSCMAIVAWGIWKERIIEGEEMGRHDEWRRLWQMEVPPKIRHLLWRASREVLPTRNALRNKGMNMVDRCGLCDAEGETVTHLFLRCEVARRCWQLVGGDGLDPVGREEAASWKEWWLNALKDGRRELLSCMAIVAWGIWK